MFCNGMDGLAINAWLMLTESNFRHTQVETDRVAGHDAGGPGVASNSPPSGKERGRASIIAPVGMLELSRINQCLQPI
jgi:hypothetical protein